MAEQVVKLVDDTNNSGKSVRTIEQTINAKVVEQQVMTLANSAGTLSDTAAGFNYTQLTDGTNSPAIKAASTAPVAADKSIVVALSPNSVAPGTVVTAGANVAASANNQTLAGAASKTTYISGFAVSGLGATAAGSINITTTGLTNNLNFVLPIPVGATVGVTPLVVTFNPPIPASAVNTAIVLNVPSFGAGNTTASASAWGFQV